MPEGIARIKRRSDFLRLARKGRKCATPGLVLQALKREPGGGAARANEPARADGPRVGFTASRKVGNAVARNRAKRRLREAANRVLASCALPDYDYVIVARPASVTRSFALLLRDLEYALRRVGARRPDEHGAARDAMQEESLK